MSYAEFWTSEFRQQHVIPLQCYFFGLESFPRGQRALRAEIPTGVSSMRGQGSGGANSFPATALRSTLSDVHYQ